MHTTGYTAAPALSTSTRLDGTPRSADTVLHNAEQIEKLAGEFVQRLESISQFIRPTPEATGPGGNSPRQGGVFGSLEASGDLLSRGLAILGEIDRKLGL